MSCTYHSCSFDIIKWMHFSTMFADLNVRPTLSLKLACMAECSAASKLDLLFCNKDHESLFVLAYKLMAMPAS